MRERRVTVFLLWAARSQALSKIGRGGLFALCDTSKFEVRSEGSCWQQAQREGYGSSVDITAHVVSSEKESVATYIPPVPYAPGS